MSEWRFKVTSKDCYCGSFYVRDDLNLIKVVDNEEEAKAFLASLKVSKQKQFTFEMEEHL